MKTIDREISWVNFNYRVLHQSMREEIPFLERLKFLGISFSNMNEFIAVRFSSVLEGFLRNSKVPDDLGKTNYDKKYDNLLSAIFDFKGLQYKTYVDLVKKLKTKLSITLCDNYNDLDAKDKKFCIEYFEENILSILTPVTYDSTKEMPTIADNEQHFLIKLSDKHSSNILCMLNVPECAERIVQISDKKFILLEEIIKMNLQSMFLGKRIEDYILFKTYKFVTDTLSMNTDEFIIDRMKKYLSDRDLSNNNAFLDVRTNKKHTDLVKVLYKIFDVYKGHVYSTQHPILLDCLTSSFYKNSKYEYEPFEPAIPSDFIGEEGIMKHLLKDDILIQHPYESFDMVVDFLKESSIDKDVISIKQTLYRVSSEDSPLIEALCRAAQHGKKVIILLEIKARFDERQNISMIEKLKESGCTLIYGIETLKVHCKMCLVTKKTKKGIKIFSHVGTGNYNDRTARVYTDISFMTSNAKIGSDLNAVFNMLSGFSYPKDIKSVHFSPFGIRKKLSELIDREVKHFKNGKKAEVVLKMNSLCDLKLIKNIYEAAEKGVKFEIICRGVCSIIASENIVVKSIVGRFLEHSRIYYFYNNNDPDIFISSADLMARNLDKRVEIMLPIKDDFCKKKLINILTIFRKDEKNMYYMNENRNYLKATGKINSHDIFTARNKSQYKIPKKIRD